MNCRVGFIGAGYMASEHIRAFRDVPGAQLCGITSRTRSRAQKLADEAGIPLVCESVDELYAAAEPNLVVIAVPPRSVREVAIEAFRFPSACLIEKPAGYDLKDAQVILDAAERHSAKAYVGLNRRHYSSTRAVLEAVAGVDGRRFIHVQDQEDAVAALNQRHDEVVVRNWMYANSIHLVDYFRLFARGSLLSVEPVLPWNPRAPSWIIAKLTYDSGDIGIYQAVWNAPGPWSVVISTQQNWFEMRPIEAAWVQKYGSRQKIEFPIHIWDKNFKPGLRLQAQLAVEAATTNARIDALPTIQEAFETMRLVRSIYPSV